MNWTLLLSVVSALFVGGWIVYASTPKKKVEWPREPPTPKHIHRWRIVAATHAKPTVPPLVSGDCYALAPGYAAHLERIMQGSTSYLLQCEDPDCGETRTEVHAGQPEKPKAGP